MGDAQSRVRVGHTSRLAEIGDILDVGVLTLDGALVVTGWNHWLELATGKRAADVVGRPLLATEPHLRPRARNALEQAVNGTTVIMSQPLHGYLLDIPAPAGTGTILRMQQSVRVLPIYGDDGTPQGAVALIQDVTERVAREDELREAMVAAQTSNQAKSNFLAAMSHELRTPIGAVSAYVDLLSDGIVGSVTDQQRAHLLRIKMVAAHLLAIVEEILTFARIDAGREQVRISDADAGQLARDAILAVEPLVKKKGLDLRYDLPSAPVPMKTDPVKVRQILINLLGNAVKFTSHGSIAVHVTASPSGSSVAFAIADTGHGIAAADLERIFEPFVQVSASHSRSHEGTGLGLAVSREFARLLGGDVTVTSEVGLGSVFTATFQR